MMALLITSIETKYKQLLLKEGEKKRKTYLKKTFKRQPLIKK